MLKLLVKQSEKKLIIKILEYTFTLFVLNKSNNMGHTFWIHQNPCDVLILHPQISQYGYFQFSSTIFKIQPFMSYFKLKGLKMFWSIVLKLAKMLVIYCFPIPKFVYMTIINFLRLISEFSHFRPIYSSLNLRHNIIKICRLSDNDGKVLSAKWDYFRKIRFCHFWALVQKWPRKSL